MRRPLPCVPLLAAAALLGGCSASDLAKPNLPPDTKLFVQFDPADGTPHTVPYQVKLSWLGTDQDGFVTNYEIRFRDPARPADTTWVRTSRTDSTFAVPTPSGSAAPGFDVRAIDNEGALDPSPATQAFTFENQQPTIRITNKLIATDSTYASVTFAWSAVDPDGDAGRLVARVWLDGNEAGSRFVSGATAFTVPSADFLQGGKFRSGPRRLYVQAIDPGGFASQPDSMTWFVRRPCPDTTLQRGRVLVVDDVPGSTGAGPRIDSLWVNSVTRVFPAGSFSVLRLALTQPFRSTADMRQTFEQFDAVIWYRGFGDAYGLGVSTLIRNNEQALRDYLDGGGTFVVEGLSLLRGQEVDGALSADFQSRYLGIDSLRTHRVNYIGAASPDAWSLRNTGVIRSTLTPPRLRLNQTYASARAIAPSDTNAVLLWALEGSLADSLRAPEQMPIAVRARQSAGGDAVLIHVPMFGLGGFSLSDPPVFLDALLRSLPAPSGPRLAASRPARRR